MKSRGRTRNNKLVGIINAEANVSKAYIIVNSSNQIFFIEPVSPVINNLKILLREEKTFIIPFIPKFNIFIILFHDANSFLISFLSGLQTPFSVISLFT